VNRLVAGSSPAGPIFYLRGDILVNIYQVILNDLLKNRFHKDFLQPDIIQLYRKETSPFILKDMDRAVDLLSNASMNETPIMIFGDYDCDGITSTSLLHMALSDLGFKVSYMIPSRSEGYGFNKRMIDEAFNKGFGIIITCDNGITKVHEVDYANSKGMMVIITDHHEPQEILPNAYATINPKQKDCIYQNKSLAGVGVAFKLIQALCAEIKYDISLAENYLPLAAVGTLSDMMNMSEPENRIITYFGLLSMKTFQSKGIKYLIEMLGFDSDITSDNILFQIGPIINSAGRLADASLAVELIISNSKIYSYRLAKQLISLNQNRKDLTEEHTQSLIEYIEHNQLDKNDILFIAYPDHIPEGLIGLIAGKLKEIYQKSTILLCIDESKEFYKGSGRLNSSTIFHFFLDNRELLLTFGGHHGACGLSLTSENVSVIAKSISSIKEDVQSSNGLVAYDADPHYLNEHLYHILEVMQPFGVGNERPVFKLLDCRITDAKWISNGKHLKFRLMCYNYSFDAIYFSCPKDKYSSKDLFNIYFSLQMNKWQGKNTLQLHIKSIEKAQD